MSGLPGWSQGVDATLYLRSKGWSGWRWTEDMLEVSMRPRERSCGTAGSTESRSRRLGERLASRRRRFIFRWLRMSGVMAAMIVTERRWLRSMRGRELVVRNLASWPTMRGYDSWWRANLN